MSDRPGALPWDVNLEQIEMFSHLAVPFQQEKRYDPCNEVLPPARAGSGAPP